MNETINSIIQLMDSSDRINISMGCRDGLNGGEGFTASFWNNYKNYKVVVGYHTFIYRDNNTDGSYSDTSKSLSVYVEGDQHLVISKVTDEEFAILINWFNDKYSLALKCAKDCLINDFPVVWTVKAENNNFAKENIYEADFFYQDIAQSLKVEPKIVNNYAVQNLHLISDSLWKRFDSDLFSFEVYIELASNKSFRVNFSLYGDSSEPDATNVTPEGGVNIWDDSLIIKEKMCDLSDVLYKYNYQFDELRHKPDSKIKMQDMAKNLQQLESQVKSRRE